MSEIVKCIDISHWQGFPDFDQVAAAGVIAMIHKATEGTSYVDPNRGINCKNAMDAGIAIATYHWIKPGNAEAQMQFYLDTIDPVEGERVVIDYEEDGCDLDDLHRAVEFLASDPRGLQITVYSGHLLKEQLNGDSDELLAAETDLWLAQYTSGTPSWSTGTYPTYTLWQYSENGEIDGINDSYVDLNRFNGSDEELLAWISPSGHAPEPPEPPQPETSVQVAITAPQDVQVNVTVNGSSVGRIRRPRNRLLIPRGPDLRR